MTLGELARQARQKLSKCSQTAALDARLLVCYQFDIDELALFKQPEMPVTTAQETSFVNLLERRLKGEPMAYLLGRQAFYGRDFRVTPNTLIPRPDTELLVDRALAELPKDTALKVVDAGCGSGIIGITLARLRPQWQLLALDLSETALAVAKDNANCQQVSNIEFLQSDWLSGVGSKVDAIICNPPYVAPQDPYLQEGDLRFEPTTALVAAQQGLAALTTVAWQAVACLIPGGWLALEHGFEQGHAVRQLLADQGYEKISTHCDLAGHERVTEGHKPC